MSKLIKPIPSLEEQKKEQEKLHDILLLLDQLFKREGATAKIILGHLYDIGTINLVNHKVPLKSVNPFLKLVATGLKPCASVIAVRAFQAYCPKLVADYLYSLVEFKPPEPQPVSSVEIQQLSLPEVKAQLQELKTLRKRVRVLTGTLVALIAFFSGSSLFVAHQLGLQPSDLLQPNPTVSDETKLITN